MKIPTLLLLAIAALPLLPATASAQSFRCKNDLVNKGDSKASALLKCGEPLVKDNFCRPVRLQAAGQHEGRAVPHGVTACESVDEWTYNPGYGQFITTLRFESGRLAAITYGERVR